MDLLCDFDIISISPERILIEDIGEPWDVFMTVTNDVENVVRHLNESEVLGNKILHYIDSNGELNKIEHDGRGNFLGFAPVLTSY